MAKNKGNENQETKGKAQEPQAQAEAASMITVKDLEKMTKKPGVAIRKVLRSKFGGGNKVPYRWDPKDPVIEEIVKALKDNGTVEKSPTCGRNPEGRPETA
ncbi:MAG: hypothetical protein V3R87_02860 [Dehalococcoidia bacterium]